MRSIVLLAVLLCMGAAACQLLLDLPSGDANDGGTAAPAIDATSSSDAPASMTDAATATEYATMIATDGAFAHWSFDETTGPWVDRVGGLQIVQGTGSVRSVPGVVATAVEVAGRMTLREEQAFDLLTAEAFSVEMWIEPLEGKNMVNTVLDRRKDDAGAGNGFFAFFEAPDGGHTELDFSLWRLRSLQTSIRSPLAVANGFAHVVVTLKPFDVLRAYVDGVESELRYGAAQSPEAGPLPMVFRLSLGGGGGARMRIDELAFYDVALTQDRIVAHRDFVARSSLER